MTFHCQTSLPGELLRGVSFGHVDRFAPNFISHGHLRVFFFLFLFFFVDNKRLSESLKFQAYQFSIFKWCLTQTLCSQSLKSHIQSQHLTHNVSERMNRRINLLYSYLYINNSSVLSFEARLCE